MQGVIYYVNLGNEKSTSLSITSIEINYEAGDISNKIRQARLSKVEKRYSEIQRNKKIAIIAAIVFFAIFIVFYVIMIINWDKNNVPR